MPVFMLENEWNDQIRLTQQEAKWQLTNVTGLNPPSASIVTTVVPVFDGARFQTSRLNERNVVIYLAINGDVSANLLEMNKVVMPKRYIKIYYQNSYRDVYIEGYVESFEYGRFDQKVMAQISVICPQPYWSDREYGLTKLTPVISLFSLPFSLPAEGIPIGELLEQVEASVKNAGTVDAGAVITIESTGIVHNPSIINVTTGEKMTFNLTITRNDILTISTIRGEKYVVISTGSQQLNKINALENTDVWIRLIPGDNLFTFEAAAGSSDMRVCIYNRNLYGGV